MRLLIYRIRRLMYYVLIFVIGVIVGGYYELGGVYLWSFGLILVMGILWSYDRVLILVEMYNEISNKKSE
jgi:hypothetical protein